MASIVEYIIKASKMSKIKEMEEDELLSFVDTLKGFAVPKRITRKYIVDYIDMEGDLLLKISSKGNEDLNAVMFIHGGAYIMEMDSFHWHVVLDILNKTKCTLYIPIYKLAPVYNYKNTDEFMIKSFEYLINRYGEKRINILGDSAGGQIALRLLDSVKYNPNKTILVSPLAYLDMDYEMHCKMKELEKDDLILSVDFLQTVINWWTLGEKLNYNDISSLKGVYIFIGTKEILYPQALRLKSEIITATLIEGKDLMHTWPYMPGDKSCIKGFSSICELLNE